ncbi:MAG TPA: hypothetical protein VGZ22_21885 [Isosphaeraceae bacterium]|jgi:hypothetical protein|nr:hypothetical protein [Isosphaeraceae bacterium]
MTSEKRLLANRRNAQKSTGPKTPEGKNASKRNALKHGLAGMGSVLLPEDEERFRERLRGWIAEEQPTDERETDCLIVAALASVRVDRCARDEFAVIARKRRDALRNWQRRQDWRISRLNPELEKSPEIARSQLEEFASGCGWLVEQWEELQQALDEAGHWTDDQARRALRLLGGDPDRLDGIDARETPARSLWTHAQQLRPDAVGEPAARVAALTGVRTIVTAEIARLAHERAEHWYEVEGPDLAEAINLATIDLSADGALRHRYAVAASSDLHRAFDQLARLERGGKERRRNADKQAIASFPRSPHPGPGSGVPHQPMSQRAPVAAVRNEAIESPSSLNTSSLCVAAPPVTTARPGPVSMPPQGPSEAPNVRPREAQVRPPPVRAP